MNENRETARRLLDALPQVMGSIRRELRAIGTPLKLTVTEIRVMRQIRRGITTISQLAQHHGISVPAMSRIVDALVTKKLVARKPDAEDRRALVLRLSIEGERVCEKASATIHGNITKKLEGLSDEELDQLEAGIDILSRAFQSN